VSKTGDTATISITDSTHTTTATVKDGTNAVSVSATGTSTSDVRYITIDGTESRFTSVALRAMKSAWVTGTTQNAATAGEFIVLSSGTGVRFNLGSMTTVGEVKAWLAAQYAAGTPVTLYYPLATPTETSVVVPTINTSKGDNYLVVDTEVSPSNVAVTYRKRTKETS